MTRRLLIAGNWKMHGSVEMATDLISEVSRSVLDAATLGEQRELAYDILVCPPSILIPSAAKAADSQPILLGAQNVHPKEQGAFTGELSIGMLAEFGCQYVLLGHSERRELFGETDAMVADKFAACIGSGSLIPILCIGETLSERQSDQTEKVVSAQLDAVLDKVGIDSFKNAVIAYEPVWAIGTGETATPEQAQRVHAFIRTKLAKLDGDIADALRILYGGSMKAENASDLLSQADIDGGLIGGASLKVSSFSAICDAAHTLALNA
jgi:triosephosphate isomerase